MIVIVDYGMGNLGSVKRRLNRIGVSPAITSDPDEISRAEKLILPGVGHFANAVKELKQRGLWNLLNNEVLVKKKPVLGICLGMQLMASHSEEGDAQGFGWIDAEVVRFRIKDTLRYKVPHTGWNQVSVKKDSLLFKDMVPEQGFYFVHAYHMVCKDTADVLCTTDYDYAFTSGIQKGNIAGFQFHPEKSHEPGEILLKNFVMF